MKILIRSTTLDGEPIPGSGETLQAADCLEIGRASCRERV